MSEEADPACTTALDSEARPNVPTVAGVAPALEERNEPQEHRAVHLGTHQVRVRLGKVLRKPVRHDYPLVATRRGASHERVLAIALDRLLQPRLANAREVQVIDGCRSSPCDTQPAKVPDVLVVLISRIQFLSDHAVELSEETHLGIFTGVVPGAFGCGPDQRGERVWPVGPSGQEVRSEL